MGSLETFGGSGLRLKDGSSVTANGSSSSNSSSSSGSNGSTSSCNSLSISNINSSFVNSVPDPGGSGGQIKDLESMSPPSNVGVEVPLSPLREYHEVQSLWVKIDLTLLSRVPGQDGGERSRVAITERDESEGRDRGLAERERQKLIKGERQEEETERSVQHRERQGDRERLTERERQMDREDREKFGFGERERAAARDREKICQGFGALDNAPVQEQINPRPTGRAERGEIGSKNRRQAAANIVIPAEKHTSKSKRKHKV